MGSMHSMRCLHFCTPSNAIMRRDPEKEVVLRVECASDPEIRVRAAACVELQTAGTRLGSMP